MSRTVAPAEHTARTVATFGADRVLQGTDWFMRWRQTTMQNGIYNDTLAVIDAVNLSAVSKEMVLGKTCASEFEI